MLSANNHGSYSRLVELYAVRAAEMNLRILIFNK